MQFLAPLFLVAMAGLAIPVILHLTQREKKQVIRFPSLMFVRRIPYQSVRRRKIHNWLLLFVRMAALALIIAAFARPLIPHTDALVLPGAGAREVVVLLDTSYSMGYGDRWERARAAARETLSSLGVADRGSLVLFSSNPEIVARSVEREKLTAAVDVAKVSAGATRFAPALKVAGSILSDTKLPRREVVLVSDFQRNGWRGQEGAQLPRGATLKPVAIGGPLDRQNVSVTAVTLARKQVSNQERAEAIAAIVNRSDRPVQGLVVKLDVDTIPHGSRTVNLPAGGTTSVTFDPFSVTGRNMRGVVRIADDALAVDNAFYFVASPAELLRVTVLDRGTADSKRFLIDALNAALEPKFEVVVRQPEALTDEDLRRSAVVVVNDLVIGSNVGRRLEKFVTEGGGLFVAAGSRVNWPSDVTLLPGTLGSQVERTSEAARMTVMEYGHPVFEQFRSPRSGNFSSVKVFGYRNVIPAKDAQLLAKFDAGSPAVLERRVGNGRVLLWASALDRSASDLPLMGIFPIVIRESMLHLAAFRDGSPSVTVGEVLDPSVAAAPKGSPSSARVALTPSGQRVPLPDEEADVLELAEQGFYEVRGAATGSVPTVSASNIDPAEGDLTPMDDPADIAAAAIGEDGASDRSSGGEAQTPETQENNQRLWQYALFAGVLLLGVDTVLSNRLAKS